MQRTELRLDVKMKFKVTPFITSLVLLIAMVAIVQAAPLARPAQQESPLRLSEPVEAVVADLERYIPEYMRQENIPGVAIALIRDGEMVWTEGFGVANGLTRQPVTPETLFEVASNSKVVTAYIALRLVDQGVLSLDAPLNAYLPEPWLPASEYRDAITLRHVLSHSSGLGHGTTSRENLFAPGRGYSYSAVGFQYLQAVIEQVTGESLEQVAQELVYTPLGMSSSSFVNRAEFTPRTANGHLNAILPALLFAVPYVVSLVIVGLFGLVILRIRTGQWRPARRMTISTLLVMFGLKSAVGLPPVRCDWHAGICLADCLVWAGFGSRLRAGLPGWPSRNRPPVLETTQAAGRADDHLGRTRFGRAWINYGQFSQPACAEVDCG